jgi:opacity protein-like surface antigen
MKLSTLIAISAVASILTQTSVFAQEAPVPAVTPAATPAEIVPAQEKSAEKSSGTPPSAPVTEKKYSIGPAIQFGGSSTSFGITGKYSVSEQFSVRPLFLLGYKPTVTKSNLNQSLLNSGVSQSDLNAPAGQAILDSTLGGIGSGFGYGASITYDFKSPDGKMVGYVGPRLLIGSTSNKFTLTDGTNSISGSTIDTSETNIGLTAGADFAITPELTAGVNATYNLYRGLKIGKTDTLNAGSSSDFGINVTYNF